jgi:hypothetical protein
MTPDNERPNPWVDPVYDTSTPRPNLHSGIGEEGLRRVAQEVVRTAELKPSAGGTAANLQYAIARLRAALSPTTETPK